MAASPVCSRSFGCFSGRFMTAAIATLLWAACSGDSSGTLEPEEEGRPSRDSGRPSVGDDEDGQGAVDSDASAEPDAISEPDSAVSPDAPDSDAESLTDSGELADADTTDAGVVPDPDATRPPDVDPDAITEGVGVYETDAEGTVDRVICPESSIVPPLCLTSYDEGTSGDCDGFDNDCDGTIDENCICKLGDVQPCFAGPPGRVSTGACDEGTQRCITGPDGSLLWGECEGGRSPRPEVCDTLDNDCNGCVDEVGTCIDGGSCPGPGDPRTPDALPFTDYPLTGADFYSGPASAWSWTIQGGPCDGIVVGRTSFTLTGANSQNAVFTPSLSGSYTVTLRVTTPTGIFECTWVIHVVGPGIRIEMCYPESTTQDLDLMMMRTSTPRNWYGPLGDVFQPTTDACSWYNCEATLRGASSRANWGYGNSPIENCSGGPQGTQWSRLGYCANPRLDIDNNLSEGTGVPENINVDNPNVGDGFRVMVHNFTGTIARPLVNVYCGGRLKATFGAAPDIVPAFTGRGRQVGAMWRVTDILTTLAPDGTTDCEITGLHPPGATTGYDVTYDDSRY